MDLRIFLLNEKVQSLLGVWLLLGALDLTLLSWNPPEGMAKQVEALFFHWRLGVLPAGLLPMYVPYFLSLLLASKGRLGLRWVLGVSVFARVILLPGYPILETDLYRYLWDGRMMTLGENPFRYAPREVEAALEEPGLGGPISPELGAIVEALREDQLHREILSRINNKTVPTIYFPTAQACFAVASRLVSALLPTHDAGQGTDWRKKAMQAMVVWKGILFLFEMGILWLLVKLLILVGREPVWVVVYGWSPLILKEYGNTGHFDPVVILLVLLGLWMLVRFLAPASITDERDPLTHKGRGGRKPYPTPPITVILMKTGIHFSTPLTLSLSKGLIPSSPHPQPLSHKGRGGCEVQPIASISRTTVLREHWLRNSAGGVLGLGAGCKLFPLLFLPLLRRELGWTGVIACLLVLVLVFAPFAGVGMRLFTGFLTYSDRWEFNSSLAALFEWGIANTQEILRGPAPSSSNSGDAPAPWFSLAGVGFDRDAFLGAKLLCGLILLAAIAALSLSPSRFALKGGAMGIIQRCYLILGALLLVSPVTDPWYVGWMVPFLCFFPNKAWLLLTFTVQAYYLYFWNDWQYVGFRDIPSLGLAWDWELARPLEYLPFYALLLHGWLRHRRERKLEEP